MPWAQEALRTLVHGLPGGRVCWPHIWTLMMLGHQGWVGLLALPVSGKEFCRPAVSPLPPPFFPFFPHPVISAVLVGSGGPPGPAGSRYRPALAGKSWSRPRPVCSQTPTLLPLPHLTSVCHLQNGGSHTNSHQSTFRGRNFTLELARVLLDPKGLCFWISH